jgi:hypothetical protein
MGHVIKEKLIEGVEGEPSGPGQFSPVFNIITRDWKGLASEQVSRRMT